MRAYLLKLRLGRQSGGYARLTFPRYWDGALLLFEEFLHVGQHELTEQELSGDVCDRAARTDPGRPTQAVSKCREGGGGDDRDGGVQQASRHLSRFI